MKKGVIEISTVVTLIMFLGTGIFNIYKIERRDPQYKQQKANIAAMQDKYCNSEKTEDLKMCVEALKLSISK